MKEKELFKKIYNIAKSCGFPVYVVGGYVRDQILGKPGKDIDFVVVGDAMKFAGILKDELKIKTLVQYPRFGTFMANYKGYNLEFVNAREESYDFESRKPVTKQADLFTDLSRRDFTINTLAMNISDEKFGEIVDVYNGRDDLEKGIIRTPLEPDQTFSDDPLRMMRAIRFATRFKFQIEQETFSAISKNSERLSIISAERIQDEFNKILMTEKPSIGLDLLDRSGLMQQFLPEAVIMKGVDQKKEFHHKDVFYHTLEVIDNLAKTSNKLELRLAGLFHDLAKPRTKRFVEGTGWTFHGHEVVGERMARAILKRLKYSNETIEYVKKLVRLHLRPQALISDEVTDSAMRRLLFLAGNEFEDLMILCRADITSKNPKRVKRYLNNYEHLLKKLIEVEERDKIRNFQPPVNGQEIMQIFNCKPGRLIGKVKKFLEEAILEGQVENDHDACIALILENKDRFNDKDDF
ncbi:MAG: HD domain-containing protein [Calditrichaeota bacterium]|nr:MAG: HD domain-containing protein [Calditrichota bacterium]MBL1208085.1 HD domain-containing protein [Calditrichota bacterium]NOG47923.1 HD domain-containing protein [Calditrichota bacterium]